MGTFCRGDERCGHERPIILTIFNKIIVYNIFKVQEVKLIPWLIAAARTGEGVERCGHERPLIQQFLIKLVNI